MVKHVAVLMGGWSAERAVSLVSGAAVAQALRRLGIRVAAIDVRRDMGALMTRLYPRPDAVFNALHGRFGEDGCVQGLLDILGIPYTHSGRLASALAMDKPMAKRLFAAAELRAPEHVLATRAEIIAADPMPRPYVVKPCNEGSSVGVVIVREGDNAPPAVPEGAAPNLPLMVERYIPGRELTVAVMGDRPLAVTEITTKRRFYDYDAKYAPGGSSHVVPAAIPKKTYAEALRLGLSAHRALGCRGVSRADLRYDGRRVYLLEVNTQPGMTSTSLVPEQAAHVGISFDELVRWMVDNAECDG
ncbi:MAG: D-alanine--D-alanine ligase [Rhodospirillales bacterium RIFCSPLOWO2_12_FULL_67_15]|nr:MAG: D-alanine--D-alanine ligase [Rhodospirillales bacterium RIFCSPLOWO2_12_FULL_67_15]